MSDILKNASHKRKWRISDMKVRLSNTAIVRAVIIPDGTPVVRGNLKPGEYVTIRDLRYAKRKSKSIHQPASEPVANPKLDRFKAAFGKLKGRKIFGDDAVQFQQEMREEWQ